MPIVGFENHGGRTYIKDNKPLGKVLYGAGNDGKSGYEGVVYKNVIGTYLHGPSSAKKSTACRLADQPCAGTEVWKKDRTCTVG